MSGDQALTTGVAGRYAAALFELANEEGALDAVEADFNALSAAIDASPELRDFIKSPVYDREDQSNAIAAIAQQAGFHILTANFLKLVAQNRRLFALPDIIKAFAALAAQHRGEAAAEAISAAPISSDQMTALRSEIEALVGRRVNLKTSVDPELLGGLIVKIGSKMIDASLKTKLNRLKSVLKEA